MTINDIIEITKLTSEEFAIRYHIPQEILENWIKSPGSIPQSYQNLILETVTRDFSDPLDFNELLKKSGLTERQFSRKFGLNYRQIKSWSDGEKCPEYILYALNKLIETKPAKAGFLEIAPASSYEPINIGEWERANPSNKFAIVEVADSPENAYMIASVYGGNRQMWEQEKENYYPDMDYIVIQGDVSADEDDFVELD